MLSIHTICVIEIYRLRMLGHLNSVIPRRITQFEAMTIAINEIC